MRNLNNIVFPECLKTIGGVNSILLGDRNTFGRYWTYAETNTLQYGIVTGSENQGVVFNINAFRIADATFNQEVVYTPFRHFETTLNLSFNQIEIVKRDTLERILVNKKIVAFVQDYNKNVWLFGEQNGMRLTAWDSQSQSKGGNNIVNISLTASRERFPIRQVDCDFYNSFIPIETQSCFEDAVCDPFFPCEDLATLGCCN